MEVQGKIKEILELQTGEKKDGSGEWRKQLFLVDTETQFNNLYYFEIFGNDKVDNFIDHFNNGDSVKVAFNINTSEYQGKYFTTLSAWKIDKQPLT